MNTPPIELLLVEDNPGDVRLTVAALRDARIVNRVHVAENGEQALRFLRREGEYGRAPRPDLVLLDLNLPVMPGHEVLRAMKSDESLKRIPVVVISGSNDDRDV